MPENEHQKHRLHIPPAPPLHTSVEYAELHVTTNFSFLRGGSHPEELVTRAAQLGCKAVAVTDINSLAGIVRGKVAAHDAQIPYIVGCHLQLKASVGLLTSEKNPDAPYLSVLVYPTDRASYARLCQLLTFGKRRAAKGQCELTLQDLLDHHHGLLAIVLPPPLLTEPLRELYDQLRQTFDDDRLSLAASCLYDGQDAQRLEDLAALAKSLQIPLVATNDVHYHDPQRKPLQDVLTCIRLGCTLDQAGFALFPNAERHLKGPDEMARLFARYPQAIARTMHIARRALNFSLNQLKYEYPAEICPPGKTMMQHLKDRTWAGAQKLYPHGIPPAVRARVEHEFELIEALNYPAYFLTVDDIVSFARSQNILCQGRGAAANSAVCYCLGITAVDPARVDMLVERFISRERDEPPDIDIDFEHERREEVIQYIYKKYGRHRAALTAEVICYRRRSAVREVGKALGLSLDCVDRLAKAGDWWEKGIISQTKLRELGFDPNDPTLQQTVAIASDLIGFPRHLSQHVGGFVITQGPLCDSVPIENAAMPDRTIIEWDKDDIDEMGMLKVDVLGLGMLTCIRKAIDLVNISSLAQKQPANLQYHSVPPEDPRVYDMLCNADSVGVFQVESRAQMSMLPRLKPRCYYDLVIEVAIVRPGPIQGGMVHPYLRRRSGKEKPHYPDDRIRTVLERTLGVPLFQEQAMQLSIVAAGFTPGEADQLRRAMAAWKRKGDLIYRFGQKIIAGMTARGYTLEFANRCFEQIKGFSEYGFPESHAASFALLVYVSAWLKCHKPAAFAAALINSQPMGFYQPAQIVRDAQQHGVPVRPVDVNHSLWDCTLEHDSPSPALRLGMRLVSGLRESQAKQLADAVKSHGPFKTIPALWRTSGVRVQTLRTLASADAFNSMGLNRQAALWAIKLLRDQSLPIFDQLDDPDSLENPDDAAELPDIPPVTRVIQDYGSTGLSLKAHPLSFARPQLNRHNVLLNSHLADPHLAPNGKQVAVAGLALIRQRPATASGIVFMTIEDETGVANLVIRPPVYERFRNAIRHSVAVAAWGKIERQGQVVHILVHRVENLATLTQNTEVRTLARNFR